jgi:diaminohydroxyphosphoribosylaminopyrimidine deaminase/5-amino-6-(5-phosphoribosylamino)uracil reductase
MKYAQTLDGKIACYTGESKWVSSEESRAEVQKLRNKYKGIMVGVGTVIADNPSLTCRLEGGRNPIRIICDTNLRTPLASFVVESTEQFQTIIATGCDDEERLALYRKKGVKIINPGLNDKGHVNLDNLMNLLGEMEIDGILLEGGGSLNESALESGIVNHLITYIAPKIFGGKDSKTAVEGMGVESPSSAYILKNPIIRRLGEDIVIEGDF